MLKPLVISLTLLAGATGAQAAAVVGGSSLLTAGYANQLEAWLGEGAITLTNLYTKQTGDTATTFHSAADNKGRTIVVMYATEDNGNSAIIGGYNKDSWNGSLNNYIFDNALGDGNDDFVFNLSTSIKKGQTAQWATYNYSGYGPTFGGGHDIYVDGSLNLGYSYGHSYGGVTQASLVDGSVFNGVNMRIGALEVFTISAGTPTGVPEPMSLALVGAALAAAAAAARRRD